MLTTFFDGLLLVLQWPAIGFLMLGVVLGVWLGAVPGLSGIVGMVIVLPFTFGMDPVAAFALLLALYAVTSTGDTLSAVLLGVPGTAAAAATVIDGYPLARKGQAERAFGAAFAVSMAGGVIGGLILAVSLPVIRPVILQFASPEFFMLGLLGLTMVGALSGASILKGMCSAGFGLLLSMIGYAPASPVPRYWFDQVFLLEGLPLIAVVLGIFAIPEVMDLAIRSRSISDVPRDQSSGGGMMQGVRDAIQNRWLVIRCSAIGIYIGMLPGLGAAIVDWVAYGHTVQSSKDKSQFGQGDIRGVIGPEAANNAVRGGALIPTVAFGIPGSASTAVLLGALLIQGLRPGQQMLVEKLAITYSMVWTIIIANIVAAVLLMAASRQIARLAFVPGHFIVPIVIVLVLMGAWIELTHIGSWIILLAAGFVGIWMKSAGWPRPPLLLGFILGPIMESGYRLSSRAFGEFGWMSRPFVIVFAIVIVFTIMWKLRAQYRSGNEGGDAPMQGEGFAGDPIFSLPLALMLLAVFVAAAIAALEWRPSARQFPLTISIPTIAMLATLVIGEFRQAATAAGDAGAWRAAFSASSEAVLLPKVALFFAMLVAVLAVSLLVGQPAALTIYTVAYILLWARLGGIVALIYGAITLAFLIAFYGKLMGVSWLLPAVGLFKFLG
ncbi:MAG: tripartite tricarboxylate transporter permease [Hyphomicrobiales bacterium]|nr:tripartite tricarboxylate transporter permease [Hyphomicrobiales bacterium]